MELINQTPLTAALHVSMLDEERDVRQGLLVAKATFEVGGGGGVRPAPDPLPVLEEDEETDLGVLPTDTHVRQGSELEVMLLGAAYAPRGRPLGHMQVELEIGERVWSLDVSGDRHWVGTGSGARPTEPVPFARMPLTWERAFGGSTDVWLDPHSVIEVMAPSNPLGRGFDPEPHARGLATHLGVPDGFPRWEPLRPLPNLEHPAHRVTAYSDQPDPCCWAPRPVIMLRREEPRGLPEEIIERGVSDLHRGFYRSAREMVLPAAPLGARVRVSGVRPTGDWGFAIPPGEVFADYVLGDRTGTKPLVPQMLVLLPEQSRFYVVYRMDFRMRVRERDERSFRLRWERRA